LSKKAQELANVILKHIYKLAREKSQKIRDEYTKISKEINAEVPNIVKLTKITDFIQTIPQLTEKTEEMIKEMRVLYETLEHFRFSPIDDKAASEDFKLRYAAIGWPKKLHEQIKLREKFLESEKERFREKMEADKKVFAREIE